MAIPHCHLISFAAGGHQQQILTGLRWLEQNEQISLSQELQQCNASRLLHLNQVRVIIDDTAQIQFDIHDSAAIDENMLREVDLYFKRSYKPDLPIAPSLLRKIHPLGLNYWVYGNDMDLADAWRSLRVGTLRDRISNTLRALHIVDPLLNRVSYTPRVNQMNAPPIYPSPPKAIFMARTWDPMGPSALTDEMAEEWHSINEMRASCIRTLRKAFGSRFYGGFSHTEHAVRAYPDCLMPNADQAKQANYLRRLRAYAIGVATTGLHGSIGWKFAEYVAFARAIVTEPLNYQVPGNLRVGQNYLSFKNADECVAQVDRLMQDQEFLEQMMRHNADYYQTMLRPDLLVMRAIKLALEQQHVARSAPSQSMGNEPAPAQT